MSTVTTTGTLDFLIDARLPPLNGFLSDTSQSILLEVTFWMILYLIYAHYMSEVFRYVMSKMEFWHSVKTRSGVFCANAQDDVVLLLILSIHHSIAGAMCAYGVYYDDIASWRHGYLLEVAFEIGDILAMILKLYPYKADNFKLDAQGGMVFHHLPGILCCGLILNANLHHNTHLQQIALWLLIGAGYSCFSAVWLSTLSLETQMPQATLGFILNATFFAYCRFWVFPLESYQLIRDVQADPQLAGTWTVTFLSIAGACYSLFNVAVMTDLIPKSIRYVKRSFDGVTPIDTEEVPLSREDRMKQQNRRRRSSILRAVDYVQEATKQRRSSLSSLAGMNMIEDLCKAEREAEEKDMVNDTELKLLQQTMQQMQQQQQQGSTTTTTTNGKKDD